MGTKMVATIAMLATVGTASAQGLDGRLGGNYGGGFKQLPSGLPGPGRVDPLPRQDRATDPTLPNAAAAPPPDRRAAPPGQARR